METLNLNEMNKIVGGTANVEYPNIPQGTSEGTDDFNSNSRTVKVGE